MSEPPRQPARMIDALEREGATLLAQVTTERALTSPVPACPGWVVADVLAHLGRVYLSVAGIVESRATAPPGEVMPPAPDGPEARRAFFAEAHARLLAALRAASADAQVWTWGDDRTVRFFHRRMLHETTVHRIDAERAIGAPTTPVDADLATDGIDELYGVVLPFGLARRPGTVLPDGSLHLHRTDGPGEWTLDAVDGTLRVGHAHGKATAAVRGPAGDLFVFAWNRGRAPSLEVFGDEAVAAAWAALAP